MRLNSFTFTNCTINKILHDSGTPQELNIMKLSRRDGAKLISSNFSVKTITIVGYVKGTSQSDLETNLDTLKQNVMITNGSLDIPYAGLYRRYIVNCSNITVSREHNHITFAPFEIRFEVCDPPFGKEITSEGGSEVLTEACSVQNVTAQRDTSSFSIGGSVSPRPIIRTIIDTAGNLGTIEVLSTTTNRSLEITTGWADGDQLEIDTEAYTVLKNNSSVDYEGVFPTFDLGTNNFEINLTPVSALDQYQTSMNNTEAIYSSTPKRGQQFIPTATTNYSKVDLFLEASIPTPLTGDVVVRIETDSSDTPSGTLAHANATTTIAKEDIGIYTGRKWVSANFSPFPLTSGTKYWIVISLAVSTNTLLIWLNSDTSSYPYLNKKYSGGVWSAALSNRLAFSMYKSITPTWHVDYNVKYNKRYL